MGIFRIYKGEEAGVKLTMIPAFTDYIQASPSCWGDQSVAAQTPRMLKRYNFNLMVEALNWPANGALPPTVNRAEVITTWLDKHITMPRHVTIWHKFADEKNEKPRPTPVTEWYNNICVAHSGCSENTPLKGLFWGTDNLKATYQVRITEEGILVDLSRQVKDPRDYSEENFKKYGVLTTQDPNVHGRTPWKVFDPGNGDPWRELSIVDADGLQVTTLGPLQDATDMTLGNALFILQCVNDKGDLAMTVGQLEAEVDELKKQRDRYKHQLEEVKGEV